MYEKRWFAMREAKKEPEGVEPSGSFRLLLRIRR